MRCEIDEQAVLEKDAMQTAKEAGMFLSQIDGTLSRKMPPPECYVPLARCSLRHDLADQVTLYVGYRQYADEVAGFARAIEAKGHSVRLVLQFRPDAATQGLLVASMAGAYSSV